MIVKLEKAGINSIQRKTSCIETVELVCDNLNAVGENMRKAWFKSGYQAGLSNSPPIGSCYLDMNEDWRRGYNQGRCESVSNGHDK